jgi:hypothetical protein
VDNYLSLEVTVKLLLTLCKARRTPDDCQFFPNSFLHNEICKSVAINQDGESQLTSCDLWVMKISEFIIHRERESRSLSDCSTRGCVHICLNHNHAKMISQMAIDLMH